MTDKIDKCLDSIHRVELLLTRLEHNVGINTLDLSEHIKRTELLEKKLSKIYALVLIGTGFAASYFGPGIIKYIGVVL